MTTTTRYGFTVPTVGSDNNTWGTEINTDLNSIDSYMYLTAIGNIGSSAPTVPTPAAGMIWIDNTTPSATEWNVQMYDGSNWVVMGTLDSTSHTYTPNGQTLPTLDGQVIIGATSGSPTAATLTAGTGVSITNGAGSITIANSKPINSFTTVSGTSQSMAVNTSYVATNTGSTVVFTLPATAAVGDNVEVYGILGNIFRISTNVGQTIAFPGSSTSVSVSSTNSYQSIKLVCVTANTLWIASDATGIFDLV